MYAIQNLDCSQKLVKCLEIAPALELELSALPKHFTIC